MPIVVAVVWAATVAAVKMPMKKSYKIALGGIVSALCIVLMFLSDLLPVGVYAFPIFAGVLIVSVVIESGYPFAFLVYTCVSLLSFFLVQNKEAVLYFIAFFGFYPIIKGLIEKIKNKLIQYVLKYIIFNICVIGAFFAGTYLFGVPKESFNLFGVFMPHIFLIIANVIFIIYDSAVTVLITQYINKWRRYITKKF